MHDSFADIVQGDEWPRLLEVDQSANALVFRFMIGENIRWFKGHFPAQPVLPGVVQTHWACSLASQAFALQHNIKRIDNLKFQSVILPNQEVSLTLTPNAAADAVTFRYFDFFAPEKTFSEGKLVF